MNEDEYQCEKCNEIWGFCPEDYDFIEEDYPYICPLCSMPITQMFKEIYVIEGLWESIKRVIKRITL